MKKYVVLNKQVGETPLSCLEAYRLHHKELASVSMAYAGRLDPMAEGKLLVLIGDECKVQEKYHAFDKAYEFEILFGVSSDTQDVLGIVKKTTNPMPQKDAVTSILKVLVGKIELPYPHFSSRTVKGKPLHMWTLEGKLNEIEVPYKTSTIHQLTLRNYTTLTAQTAYDEVSRKIELIPKVTDERKAIGNDFRRDEVRASWKAFIDTQKPDTQYARVKIRCIASSGTYMRTLASHIAEKLGTQGLAYSIKRTHIGTYVPLTKKIGFWKKSF